MLDQTGASAARLVPSAFPELGDHADLLSLLDAMGFQFGRRSGFLPSARERDLEALLNCMFVPTEERKALCLLNTITNDDTNGETMRARLAALRVSAGLLTELGKAVKGARSDYREVVAEPESMHRFVATVRLLAPGVPGRSAEVFREYVL